MFHCADCDNNVKKLTQLQDQIKQNQEDNNFVKTLWRQVQSEHVDIGLIVNTVLDRVTQQSEEKDNNILLILQDKDSRIAALTSEVSWLTSRVEEERREKETMQQEWERKQDDLNELISELEEQVAIKNLQILDPVKQEREQLAEKLDQKKSSLENQLIEMRSDLQSCVQQMDTLKKRHEEQVAENDRLREMCESKRQEAESHKVLISELKESLSERREEAALLKEQLQFAQSDANNALRALEKSDAALREAQEQLLEVKRAAHLREEKHCTSLQTLNQTIAGLERRVTELLTQEHNIREECERLKKVPKDCSDCKELQITLQARDQELEEGRKFQHIVSLVKDKCVSYLSRPLALQDIPDVVDIILADVTGCNEDLERSSKLVKQLQLNCQEKGVALSRVQEIHDKRLERMSTLQEHLSEVLDEVKELDKDRWRELSRDVRELSHNPQPLRHEDSSTVWADLQHYKSVCSKLKRQLDKVEEELDQIKLQRVMDINTFNEMKAAVLEDKRDCERKLRVANHQSICGCNLQLELLREKMEEMKEKAESLNSENIKLLSALQAERSRVSKLEGCVCDLQDSATQTLVHSTCSVGTFTDNVTQVRQLDDNFSNTLSLLNKLTARAQEDVTTHNTSPANPTSNPASNPASKPADARQRTAPLKGRRNKTVSCQTISRPPIKVLQKPPAALKIRLASLNQQVAVLTKAKNRHAKDLLEGEVKVEKLENQLAAALRQLSSSQQLVHGLNEDVRLANEETRTIRDQMLEIERSGLRQSELSALQEKNTEIRKLTHHNNLLSSQISTLNSNFTGLERQLEEKKGEVKRLEDKLCKREKTGKEQRSENERVREELVAARSDREELLSKIEELNKRLKRLQEVSDNRKNYIDTVKSQLSNAKLNLEEVNARGTEVRAALENKTRELRNLTRKQEAQDKHIDQLQVLASRQLEEQGRQFCAVENNLNKKLTVLSKRNLEWEKCIRQAVGKIVGKIKEEKDRKLVASSLSSEEYDRAKHLSSSLLQLSEADFHDIMSSTKVENSADSEDSIQQVWRGQLAKILCLDDFGPVLANSLFQLFEEYAKLVSGEYTSTCTLSGHSLTHSSEQTPTRENSAARSAQQTPIRIS